MNYKDYAPAISGTLLKSAKRHSGHADIVCACEKWSDIILYLKSKPIILDAIVKQMEMIERLGDD